MRHFYFCTLVRIIKFFHLEKRIPQLRQMDARDLRPGRLFYHYGRIIYSLKNPKHHICKYRVVTTDGQTIETESKAQADGYTRCGAMVDEINENTPCHLCDLRREGLPCCVCNMDVYFRKVDEFAQHGC